MSVTRRRALGFSGCCVAAAAAAVVLKPTRRAVELYPPIQLEQQVPAAFGAWQLDRSLIPILPDPGTQAALDKLYTQVLARTYINAEGARVMLSIAYGADQGSEATAAHRPEFCYSAQGFSVTPLGEQALRIGGQPLTVRRLVGTLQGRREPISYWVTLLDKAVLPGVTRKLEQIRIGLQGQIPDGMLVRVSTIAGSDAAGFGAQEQFMAALWQALAPPLRARYFGS